MKMKDDMQEYLDDYIKEAEELLQELNSSLINFEKIRMKNSM